MIYHIQYGRFKQVWPGTGKIYGKSTHKDYCILAKSDADFKKYVLDVLPGNIFNRLIIAIIQENKGCSLIIHNHIAALSQYIDPIMYNDNDDNNKFMESFWDDTVENIIKLYDEFDYDKYFDMEKIREYIQINVKPCDICEFLTSQCDYDYDQTIINTINENTFHICPVFSKYEKDDIEERIEYLHNTIKQN